MDHHQKKWFLSFFLSIIFLLLLSISSKAQEVDSLKIIDTLDTRKQINTRWLLLDIGWNGGIYYTGFTPPPSYIPVVLERKRSLHFGLNIFRQRINIYKHRLHIEYAVALNFDRFELENPYSFAPHNNLVTPSLVDTVSFSRNSLHLNSWMIPILLQYESNDLKKWKSFHVALGGHLGILMGANQKQKTIEGNRYKVKGDFNLPPIYYGLQGEIGFSYLTLFTRFNLSPFFIDAEDSGLAFTSFTFGLRLIPFF